MTEELVLRSRRDSVVTLMLNRPEKLNALTPGVFALVRQHVDELATDESVSCVIFAGAGRSFCAGNDLDGIADRSNGPEQAPLFPSETVDAIEALPMPTIARIQGHCFTGGLEFALACDLLIAADDAQLGDTHGQWGLSPMWGMSVRLPERVGRSTAKELMFTARRISGADAAGIGLVDRAVPAADLESTVDALADEIAVNSRGTNRIEKALMAAATSMTRTEALLHERSLPFGLPDDIQERMSRGRR